MASLRNIFTEHPASVGETYLEHMHMSASFGARMLFGACACFVHAFLPFLCERTGSNQVRTLHNRMVTNRDRRVLQTQYPQMDAAEPNA